MPHDSIRRRQSGELRHDPRRCTRDVTQTSVRPRNDIVASGSVTQVVYISKTITIQGGYTTTDNFVSPLPLTRLTTIDAQNKGARRLYRQRRHRQALRPAPHARQRGEHGRRRANTGEDAGGGLYAYGGGLFLTGATIFSNTPTRAAAST